MQMQLVDIVEDLDQLMERLEVLADNSLIAGDAAGYIVAALSHLDLAREALEVDE